MKAKTGKLVNAVAPLAPEEVFGADDANPGKAAAAKAKEIETKKGKYGKTDVKPFKPADGDSDGDDKKGEEKPKKESWVEFALNDEENNPVSGLKYEVELPDGSVSKGTTGGDGKAKIEGFEPGKCKLTLPDLHKDAW